MNRIYGLLLATSMLLGAVACIRPGLFDDGSPKPDSGRNSLDAGGRPANAGGGVDAGNPADAGSGTPSGHTLDLGGIAHRPGNTDPLKNCASCHGADLKGGTAQSCYTCHDNADHTTDRQGKKHKSGDSSTCNACHGPDNGGGIGPACTKCHASSGGGAPADHTLKLGNAAHRPGHTDPLKNCASCHGANLKGGTAQSCYTCHDNADHTTDRQGKKHKSGDSSTCNACHGPNNGGGLGPACTECHASSSGGAPADHTLKLGNAAHRPGNTDPLKNCVSCHGANLKGGTAQSCYTCHKNADHTTDRQGKKHKSGDSSTCNACHGPGNAGGLGPACTKCHASSSGGAPADHTLKLGNAAHRPGHTDPRRNCTSCHGSNLRGGTGRSCYSCHNRNDHTVNREGRRHKSGSSNSCSTCHGPGNSGGLGPACASCHDGEGGDD